MRETEYDTDRKVYHVLGLEESVLSKWLYYPRQSTLSMQLLSNYPWHFFSHRTRTEKKILKFVWKPKGPEVAKATLRKENRAGEIMLSDFRLYVLSFSHQNRMVLAQKQKYKSME